MKRLICALLCLCLLAGCAATPRQKPYTVTFLTLFDTVTTISGIAPGQEAFTAQAQRIHDALLEYHQLFDIYQEYPGLNNLKTVNDSAGLGPITVDRRIIQLLLDCKEYYRLTGGTVNVAMGGVLRLWHEARADSLQDPAHPRLPPEEALREASGHWDPEAIVIDEEASTVFLSDPLVRLDVGAIAKGWAVQRVCQSAPSGLLVSIGGNVFATGPKDDTGTPWVIGVQDPQGSEHYLHTLNLSQGSVVTSGDYQRAYTVDGQLYHHIIDPATLFPGKLWRSVTVVCPDSGLADALSTALFLLPLEDGQQLLDRCQAKAMWVDSQGRCFYSQGFQDLIRT